MSSQIWLISDTHFFHQNIYTFTYTDGAGVVRRVRERFSDAGEGDEYMIQRWADLVKPGHHIWHLGDLTLERGNHRDTDLERIIKGLPGQKTLFLGNHDHKDARKYFTYGFHKVRASNRHDGYLLSHYPIHPSSVSFSVKGVIHGHTHQQPDIDHRYLNVSVERTDYEPIPIEEAVARLARKAAVNLLPVADTGGNLITGP